jgi:phosphatidylglycerol:prolipoprotein diacylglycerol transferase
MRCCSTSPYLAYGIGRLGCQFSGDGDWGIYNSAYVSTPQGNLVQAPNRALYDSTVAKYPQVFIDRDLNHITPDKFVPAPSMLPDWLFAQNFKHNVNNDGVPILGDRGNYNHTLPAGVFPTSMYEAVICFFLFLFLWNMRKRFTGPLQLFGLYLICNGLERFTIESIRVNTTYDWGFIHPTQAQIIAVSLMLVGFTLFLYNKTKNKQSLSH